MIFRHEFFINIKQIKEYFKNNEEARKYFLDDSDEELEEVFYIFKENLPILDIYQIARNYIINEFYSLDSNIVLALIKDKHINVTSALEKVTSAEPTIASSRAVPKLVLVTVPHVPEFSPVAIS